MPNIRPLETLHNSLSLNQITEFFDKIIKVIFQIFEFLSNFEISTNFSSCFGFLGYFEFLKIFRIFQNFSDVNFFILDGRSRKST